MKAQQRTIGRPPPPSPPQKDLTFGIHATGDGRNAVGNSIVHIEGNTLKVDDKEYELTPGLRMLILYKKPRPQHYTSDDYSIYKAIVAQTRVRSKYAYRLCLTTLQMEMEAYSQGYGYTRR